MLQKPKVLLLGQIDHAEKEWEALSNIAKLVTIQAKNRVDFLKECREGKLDGVVVAYSTLATPAITGRFDAELVNALPKSWIFLCNCGAGYDYVDSAACTARDPPLRVSNVPSATDDSTADTAIFLMLSALRNFHAGAQSLRRGAWRGDPLPSVGHDPQGKILGILGMGSIGRNISKKAAAFGMTTIYHNRAKVDEEKAGGAEYVAFDELLQRCDVLSLNLPLNPKTRGIISTKQFKLMKPSAIVVNTARGAVMDESALVDALEKGHIAGAGLDVYENEPMIHEGLLTSEKVMLLPHMGTWTYETQYRMEKCVISNIRSVVKAGKLLSPIPEQTNL